MYIIHLCVFTYAHNTHETGTHMMVGYDDNVSFSMFATSLPIGSNLLEYGTPVHTSKTLYTS